MEVQQEYFENLRFYVGAGRSSLHLRTLKLGHWAQYYYQGKQ